MNEELKKEAEEAGELHKEYCCVNTEDCDVSVKDGECCESMKFIGELIDKATLAERKRCAEVIEPLLLKYVGDNTGENCLCDGCEDNRNIFRTAIEKGEGI